MDSQKAMPSSPLDEKMKQIELKQNEFEYKDMSRLIALCLVASVVHQDSTALNKINGFIFECSATSGKL